MFKVAITTIAMAPYDMEREMLRDLASVVVTDREIESEEGLLDFAGDADALMLGDVEPVTRRVIYGMEGLKVIVRYGIGVDNIDIEAASERGILVANVPDYCVDEVADHAMALILALNRRLFAMDRRAREGRWREGIEEDIRPIHSCRNRILGFVGLGKIGKRVAKRAKGFGFRLIAYDPFLPRWEFDLLDIERAESIEEVLKEADVLTLHLPLSDETRHIIGEEELRLMKPTSYIVNVSRGELIDSDALYIALKEGWIAGAGLDVFEREPLTKEDPLLTLDNVIATPHLAWYSEESRERVKRDATKAVIECLKGGIPEFLVNPEAIERRGQSFTKRHAPS